MSGRHVVVVGAGVIGLSCALQLRRRGHDVTVFDAGEIGAGASAGNAGWIVPSLSAPVAAPGALSYGMRSLLHRSGGFSIRATPTPSMVAWGLRFARATRRSAFEAGLAATAQFAVGAARSFADLEKSGVTTSIRSDGMLIVFDDEATARRALPSYSRLSKYGINVDDYVVSASELKHLEPGLGRSARSGIYFPDEQYVDPEVLCAGIASRAVREGVVIRTHSPVDRVTQAPHPEVLLRDGSIIADSIVVLAAGTESTNLARGLGYKLPMQAGKGYSVRVRPEAPLRRPVYIPDARAALTPTDDGLRIAGVMELGGRSLRIDGRRLSHMQQSAESYFAEDFRPGASHEWAGLRPVSADSLPVIGAIPNTRDAFIATGHAMLGVTLGPLTGESIADLVSGVQRPLIDAFSPARFSKEPHHDQDTSR